MNARKNIECVFALTSSLGRTERVRIMAGTDSSSHVFYGMVLPHVVGKHILANML
jgi:hypothetical protein